MSETTKPQANSPFGVRRSAFGVQRGVLQNTAAETCLLLILRYGLAVSEIFTSLMITCMMQQVI